MKILLLNGNPFSKDLAFESYIKALIKQLEEKYHRVVHAVLRTQNINYCNGCWGCWIKTPGQCATKDDSHNISQDYITSQLVIFSSPLIMGFTSALLKKANDKLLQLLHPYIEILDGECHHMRRYEHYPPTGLVIKREKDTDDEDIDIVTDIYKRNAINMRSELKFFLTTNDSLEKVIYEIDNI